MQMDRERWNNGSCFNGNSSDHVIIDLDSFRCNNKDKEKNRPLSSSGSVNSLCSNGNNGNNGCSANYIEHHVSKMDTLAGVAIKYGVEVADIKKMNGLVTDLQMFALKSLQIPLPGRHPPSPIVPNDSATPGESSSEHSQSRKAHFDLLESLQSLKFDSPDRKVTPAMSSLQGYYRLKNPPKSTTEGTEMSVYGTGKAHAHYLEDGPFLDPSAHSEPPPLGRHRKSRSLANGFHVENSDLSEDVPVTGDVESEKLKKPVRRRQKAETEINSAPPKGLAQRTKSTNRISVAADENSSWLNPLPLGLGDTWELVKPTPLTSFFDGVRKSSSTSNLQEQESNGSSNWAWNLKPDLQVFSAATLARPIFDGLPKPISGRRGKAALD